MFTDPDPASPQVGLFRKSGVRSRIQKVREMCEAADGDEPLAFDEHQAYDVADMVKQYFRELPEVLLTHKISEILIAIYQCEFRRGKSILGANL